MCGGGQVKGVWGGKGKGVWGRSGEGCVVKGEGCVGR